MIPEWDVTILQNVDLSKVVMADEEILGFSEEEWEMGSSKGLVCNHSYEDLRWLDWEQFEQALSIERRIIPWIAERATTFSEFEEICKHPERIEGVTSHPIRGIEGLYGFDIGMASITIAIHSLGGAVMSSCRGHYQTKGDGPFVAFYATRRIAKCLLEHATRCNCRIENANVEDCYERGLVLRAGSIIPLLNMAESIYTYFKERDEELEELAKED